MGYSAVWIVSYCERLYACASSSRPSIDAVEIFFSPSSLGKMTSIKLRRHFFFISIRLLVPMKLQALIVSKWLSFKNFWTFSEVSFSCFQEFLREVSQVGRIIQLLSLFCQRRKVHGLELLSFTSSISSKFSKLLSCYYV